MNISKKCVIYARVSTSEQAKLGYSLEAQEATLREYAEKNDLEVINIYIDAGISGKSTKNRPSFNEMMKEVLNTKSNIDTILIWKLSRLSRRLLDTLDIFEILNNHNKRLISVSEMVDSLSPMGKMLVTMHSWVAEMERDSIIDNVKHGMTKKAQSGFCNGHPPLGYDIINKMVVVNEEQAVIIKTIFDLYVNKNMGYKAIAIYLNERNITTLKNNKWDVSTIREKIRNPIYAGFISWNKLQNYSTQRRKNKNETPVFVKGQHEPIIDIETWEKSKFRQENSPAKFTRMYPGEFLISGLLRCPDCGGPMVGYRRKKQKTGTIYRYYQCNNARTKGTTACKHNMVSADYIEKAVLDRLTVNFKNTTILKDSYDKINKFSSMQTKENEKELKSIDIALNKIEIKLKKLLELRMNDEINYDEYMKYRSEFIENRTTLTTKKTSILNALQNTDVSTVSFEKILEIIKNFNKSIAKTSVINPYRRDNFTPRRYFKRKTTKKY